MRATNRKQGFQKLTFHSADSSLQFNGNMTAPTADIGSARLTQLAERLDAQEGYAEVVAALQAGHGGALGGVWGSSWRWWRQTLSGIRRRSWWRFAHATAMSTISARSWPFSGRARRNDFRLGKPRPVKAILKTTHTVIVCRIEIAEWRGNKTHRYQHSGAITACAAAGVAGTTNLAAAGGRRNRSCRAAQAAGRRGFSQHQCRRVTGRILAARRHHRRIRSRLASSGANRILRRHSGIDPAI